MSNEKNTTEVNQPNAVIDTARLLVDSGDEPSYCKKEYCETACTNCEFNESETVSHPGGDATRSAERHYCEWGHWEEDF